MHFEFLNIAQNQKVWCRAQFSTQKDIFLVLTLSVNRPFLTPFCRSVKGSGRGARASEQARGRRRGWRRMTLTPKSTAPCSWCVTMTYRQHSHNGLRYSESPNCPPDSWFATLSKTFIVCFINFSFPKTMADDHLYKIPPLQWMD